MIPGVDGQSFSEVESCKAKQWLGELAEELRKKTYRPAAVRRVWIPKADGKQRPLGRPTIRDRVVQMAIVLVVKPIFEKDLQPEQHAYRAGHNAHGAVAAVQGWLDRGYTEVVDADLSGYFDTIAHHKLMKCVARRISDRRLLHLVKMWLEAAREETDEKGRKVRTTRNKDEGRGTPQDGVASPLLVNLYMRRFVLGWKQEGHEQQLESPHRELCGRIRDLLQAGAGRCGPRPDAVDDGAAENHGERAEDAAVLAPGTGVHLPGIHMRGARLLEDGPEVSHADAVQEQGSLDL